MIKPTTINIKALLLDQEEYSMIFDLLRDLYSFREDINEDKEDDIQTYISMFQNIVDLDMKYIHIVEEKTIRRLGNFLKELINLHDRDITVESVMKTEITFNGVVYTGESKMFTNNYGTVVEVDSCYTQIADDILTNLLDTFFLEFDCESETIYALETTLIQI